MLRWLVMSARLLALVIVVASPARAGQITTDVNSIFRDYEVDGVPSSGSHAPVKSEIRGWGALIDNMISPSFGITRSQIATTTIPTSYQTFTVAGYSTVFDGGEGCEWTRATSTAPGAVQSADGAYWALSRNSAINLKCVGGLNNSANIYSALVTAADLAKSESPGIGSFGKIELSGKHPYYVLGTAGFTLANGQSISGCDAAASTIQYSPTTGTALTVAGGGNIVECLALQASNATNTAVGIQAGIGAADEGAQGRNIRNVSVNDFDVGINSVSTLAWTLGPAIVQGFNTAGLKIDNPTCDGGDFSIYSFVAGARAGSTGAGIDWSCSGGLKISNTKLLGGAYGFRGNIRDGQVTQDLQFSAVSIENQSVACWFFTRQGATGVYGNITIASSECAGAPTAIDFVAGGTGAAVVGNAFSSIGTRNVHISNGVGNIVVGPNAWDVSKPSIVDDRTDFDSEWGDLHWNYTRPYNHLDAAYASLWKVDAVPFRGAHISITYEGVVQGLGSFVRTDELDVLHDGTTALVDKTFSNTVGPTVDVVYDTATTAGSVILKIRRNQSFGGTELQGTASIAIKGKIKQYVAQ